MIEFIQEYWPYVLMALPILTSILGKAGLIGVAILHAIKASADGKYSDTEKLETMNDLIAIGKGIWFNRSVV